MYLLCFVCKKQMSVALPVPITQTSDVSGFSLNHPGSPTHFRTTKTLHTSCTWSCYISRLLVKTLPTPQSGTYHQIHLSCLWFLQPPWTFIWNNTEQNLSWASLGQAAATDIFWTPREWEESKQCKVWPVPLFVAATLAGELCLMRGRWKNVTLWVRKHQQEGGLLLWASFTFYVAWWIKKRQELIETLADNQKKETGRI